MKVKDLINALIHLDPDLEVILCGDEDGWYEADGVKLMNWENKTTGEDVVFVNIERVY